MTKGLPAKIDPASLTALVDTREQMPLDLSPLRTETATLSTGDYSLRGLEHVVRIERKSLPDLVACVGRERDRFEREVERLRGFEVAVLLVEATWQDIEFCHWRGKITPKQIEGSLLGWAARGLNIHLVGDHKRASKHTARILYTVARRRYRELREFFQMTAKEAPCP